MEGTDLSPRNSVKTAREVLSRASGVWVGGPGGLNSKRYPNCPPSPSDNELLVMGSETWALSSSFYHVLPLGHHFDPQSLRFKDVKTPQILPTC